MKVKQQLKSLKWRLILSSIGIFLVLFYFSLPKPLFNDPYATVVTSADGDILAAQIAADGQWRFPLSYDVPPKFEACILNFEDQYFRKHPGINPVSLFNSLVKNIREKKVVSGGSTITMQTIRLARKGQARTYWEKIKEIFLAVRLECSYSKDEILALYAAHAPFGGNVVGLEAASRRYFGRSANQLSWAEAATLAVLPNAPSLIYPGKNEQFLLKKRNRLLKKLLNNEVITQSEYEFSLIEELPGKPMRITGQGVHLMQALVNKHGSGQKFTSTIIPELQQKTLDVLKNYQDIWEANGVFNAGVIVAEVETGSVVAYLGNTGNDFTELGRANDMVTSPRSSGSILKPLLFGAMLQDGLFYPASLQSDVPIDIGGYSPQNYNLKYSGAVPAWEAIAKSLNVPAVNMLNQYGVARFHHRLKQLGLTTLSQVPSHYGLSLILGGAETTLWDLAKVYGRLANQLKHQSDINAATQHWKDLSLLLNEKSVEPNRNDPALNSAAIYEMFEAMSEVNRPETQTGWREFLSNRKIAWKTGTSFGHRDAWAVGLDADYVVCVWVGNASGEGNRYLSGVNAAAPVLFDVFAFLPRSPWFDMPEADMQRVNICLKSGDRAGEFCEQTAMRFVPKTCLTAPQCRYHHLVYLDSLSRMRANASCSDMSELIGESFFTLPPLQEFYYKSLHTDYKALPPWKPGCNEFGTEAQLEFIYPPIGAEIIIPKSYNEQANSLIAKVACRNKESMLFWFLNGVQLPSTRNFHEQAISAKAGDYELLVIDEMGNQIRRKFSILNN